MSGMNDLKLWQADPYLEPFRKTIWKRHEKAVLKEHELRGHHDTLANAVNGYLFYGLHRTAEGWVFREWAPNATAIYLIGDFNNWEKNPDFALQPIGGGNWEIRPPAKALHHLDIYKLIVEWPGGEGERIPSFATRAVQDEQTKIFSAQVWQPAKPYKWKHRAPGRVDHPLIYEAHVGMSSHEERISTFNEFRKKVLPRIVALGYNTIQLMAVQEHPYYGSFGHSGAQFCKLPLRYARRAEAAD